MPVWVCGRTFEGMGVTIRFCVKERQWDFWQKEREKERRGDGLVFPRLGLKSNGCGVSKTILTEYKKRPPVSKG